MHRALKFFSESLILSLIMFTDYDKSSEVLYIK